MSKRLSERKAKIAASRFLKRLTGADDLDVGSSSSMKRKSKPSDNAPAAKKSKNFEIVHRTSNIKQCSMNLETAGAVSKNHKVQESDSKPQRKTGGIISTRSQRSVAAVDVSQDKKIKTSSVSSKPCIAKDCKKVVESTLTDEPYQENVKCEPIIEFSDSDQADGLQPNAVITEIDTALESAVIMPIAEQCPSIELSSGNDDKDCKKSEIDFDSVLCNEYSQYSGVKSFSCFSCSSPECSGCQSVVTTALDGSQKTSPECSGCQSVVTTALDGSQKTSPECSGCQSGVTTALDESQKTDQSETQSNHSADNCEYKDLISNTLVDDSCGLEVSNVIDYPTMSQGDFLAIFGLINKLDLPPPSSSLSNRLHREAGGTLRRCIKSYREPQMVYRRTNVKDLCAVDRAKASSCDPLVLNGTGHSKVDSQKVVYGLRKLTSSGNRFSQFATKKVKIGKHDSPAKLPSVDNDAGESDASFMNSADSTTHDLTLLADAALANGALRHADCDKSIKSNNFSPAKEEFKKPKSLAKGAVPLLLQDTVPSRRSARQCGSQRREWRHLLRANPDEHEVKSQDGSAESKRTSSNKAKDGKQTPEETSSLRCNTPLSMKDEESGLPCKSEKLEATAIKRTDSKNVVKGALKKSHSLPISSSSTKSVKPASGVTVNIKSVFPGDLCDRKDDSQERNNDWGILKYRYKDMECVTPHMCTICWINDHMYCKNMKRTGSDLPHFLPCIHYIACSHFRSIPFNTQVIDDQGSAFRNVSGESLDQSRMKSTKSFRWNRNELISLDSQRPAQKVVSADDLLCEEVMPDESDADSSNHSAEGTELLQIQLKARTAQIFQSLGVAELPHGKSPPLVHPQVDLTDDCDSEMLELTDIAAEVCVGEGDCVDTVNCIGELGITLCSPRATEEKNCVDDDHLPDVMIVPSPNRQSMSNQNKCVMADNINNSGEVTEIELISDEQFQESTSATVIRDTKVNSRTSGELSKPGIVKASRKKATASSKCKTKEAPSCSVQIAGIKKSVKNKGKSTKNESDIAKCKMTLDLNSGRFQSGQYDAAACRDRLASLLLATDSDLIVCQTAVDQHKHRQSVLKVDASKITEQLKMKRAQLAAYEKEKHELKRRYDSLQSQLSDIKRSALQYHQFVGLFDKFMPPSSLTATSSSLKFSVALQNGFSECGATTTGVSQCRAGTANISFDAVCQVVSGVRSVAQSVVLERSTSQSMELAVSPTGSTTCTMAGIKPSDAVHQFGVMRETSCKPCTLSDINSRVAIRYGEKATVKLSDGIRNVAICQSQPSLRSVQFVTSSVRLVVPPGWSLPVSRAQPVSISAKPSAPNHMGEVVKAVYVNPSAIVRHVSHKSSPTAALASVNQTFTHSSGPVSSSPRNCSIATRFTTATNFLPVINVSKHAMDNAAVTQKDRVVHVHVSDDDDSEPELCFYGYKDRSFLQSQVQPMPNMLTPDPSCSSQESSKSSQDY